MYAGEPVLVMSLALLGKLCILAAIFISILYSIELFPTVVRYKLALRVYQVIHTYLWRSIYNVNHVIIIQTAVCIRGELVFPARLSGQLPRPPKPKWSDLIGCHGCVQQWTNHRLRNVPAAAGDQRRPTSWFSGGLWQAASVLPTQHRRPLEDTVRKKTKTLLTSTAEKPLLETISPCFIFSNALLFFIHWKTLLQPENQEALGQLWLKYWSKIR